MEPKTYKKFTRKTTLQVGKLSGNVPVSMCSFSAIGLTIFFLVCNYWVQNFFIEEWSVGLIAESSVKIYIYYGNCTSSILLGSFYYYYHFDKVMKIKPFYANALLSLCSWKKKKYTAGTVFWGFPILSSKNLRLLWDYFLELHEHSFWIHK